MNQDSDEFKAALYDFSSLFNCVALHFLLATAVEMLIASRKSILNEYAFISIAMISWLMLLFCEWRLKLAWLEGVVYVSVMAIILIVYASISL